MKDHGIGIAPDQLERIFETYYQVDSSPTRHYGGMGIGLPIVRHFLNRQNTTIFVESELGVGSTFWFPLRIANLRS